MGTEPQEADDAVSVGVALSSGGASALAQVGVLEVLLEAGIPIRYVAGTSAGSIVGAVLAADKIKEFSAAASQITLRRVFRFFNFVWPRGALLEFRGALDFVRDFVPETIDKLDRKFAAVAVDLGTGQEVVLDEGNTLEVVRASCSIPGIFAPFRRGAHWLADGALSNPLPVGVARGLGAPFVIGINALFGDQYECDEFACAIEPPPRSLLERGRRLLEPWIAPGAPLPPEDEAIGEEEVERMPRNLRFLGIMARATRIMQSRIVQARLRQEPADFLINVPTGDIGVFDFHRSASLIEVGRAVATKALPDLRARLARPTRVSRRVRRWWREKALRSPRASREAPTGRPPQSDALDATSAAAPTPGCAE